MNFNDVLKRHKSENPLFNAGIDFSELSEELSVFYEDRLIGIGYKIILDKCEESFNAIISGWKKNGEEVGITLEDYFEQQVDTFRERGFPEVAKVMDIFFELMKVSNN